MALTITKPIEDHQLDAIDKINELAGEKILAIYPQHKQSNFAARAVELIALGQVGSDEWLSIQSVWDWINSIRTQSNTSNAAIDSAASVAEIRTITQEFIAAIALL